MCAHATLFICGRNDIYGAPANNTMCAYFAYNIIYLYYVGIGTRLEVESKWDFRSVGRKNGPHTLPIFGIGRSLLFKFNFALRRVIERGRVFGRRAPLPSSVWCRCRSGRDTDRVSLLSFTATTSVIIIIIIHKVVLTIICVSCFPDGRRRYSNNIFYVFTCTRRIYFANFKSEKTR